jgi:hypothetical protein
LWALAAIYALPVVFSGFVNWTAPNVYVSALVLALGLTVNWLLLRRATTLAFPPALGLMLVSIALSATLAAGFTYMAVGP